MLPSAQADLVTRWNTPGRATGCRWCAFFSAALPPIVGSPGRDWNGHRLTDPERESARQAHECGGCQAAFEWLSEHVT